jgi:hypothetical protein
MHQAPLSYSSCRPDCHPSPYGPWPRSPWAQTPLPTSKYVFSLDQTCPCSSRLHAQRPYASGDTIEHARRLFAQVTSDGARIVLSPMPTLSIDVPISIRFNDLRFAAASIDEHAISVRITDAGHAIPFEAHTGSVVRTGVCNKGVVERMHACVS